VAPLISVPMPVSPLPLPLATVGPLGSIGLPILILLYWWPYHARARTLAREGRPVPGWRQACYAAGLFVLAVALSPPVDTLADQLLIAHMVEHLLIGDFAALLIVLGFTGPLLAPLLRIKTIGWLRVFTHPVVAVVCWATNFYVWHLPVLYQAALRHDGIHALEHVCFAVAGMLYWWHLISPIRSRLRLGGMGPVLYMVSTKLLVGLLGLALAFAPSAIYPFYEHHPHYWGLTPGEDQNMAGLIMALEQSIVMGIALAWLFIRMLAESEREAQRQERFEVV
jgi:putative membrane protein